jgi:hypothetical protein
MHRHRFGPGFLPGRGLERVLHHLATPAAPSDEWLNILQGLGAAAACLTFLVGLVVAFRYSRKANISVSGKASRPGGHVVIEVRPSATAIGPLALKFGKKHLEVDEDETAETAGAWLSMYEMLYDADVQKVVPGEGDQGAAAFPRDEKGLAQFVNPGETLTGSEVFRVDPTTPNLVGWTVCLNVDARGLRSGMHWLDRVFVPVPE